MKTLLGLIWVCLFFPAWVSSGEVSTLKNENGPTLSANEMRIGLNRNYNRPVIAGETAVYGVKTSDLNNQPIRGASVQFRATGGKFENTGSTSCQGGTKDNGWFHANWLVPAQAGNYQIQWQANYRGFEQSEGVFNIEVLAARTTENKISTALNLNYNRPVVAGETAVYGVKALDLNNQPMRGASVQFRATGGQFAHTQTSSCRGGTENDGWFQARWVAPRQAGNYQIQWQMSYPGFALKEGTINIEVQPGAREPITANATMYIQLKDPSGNIRRNCSPPFGVSVAARHEASGQTYTGRIANNCTGTISRMLPGRYEVQLTETGPEGGLADRGDVMGKHLQMTVYLQHGRVNNVYVAW